MPSISSIHSTLTIINEFASGQQQMQVKMQFASHGCLHGGSKSTAQPQKSMERHYLSILALEMLFQEAGQELVSVTGVCVVEQGQALLGK